MNEFNRWLPEKPVVKTEDFSRTVKNKLKTASNLKKGKSDKAVIKMLLEDMVEFVSYRIDHECRFEANNQAVEDRTDMLYPVENEMVTPGPETGFCNSDISVCNSDISDILNNSITEGDNENNKIGNEDVDQIGPSVDSSNKNENTKYEEKERVSSDSYRSFKVFLVDAGKSPLGRAKIIGKLHCHKVAKLFVNKTISSSTNLVILFFKGIPA